MAQAPRSEGHDAYPGAEAFLPPRRNLRALQRAAAACRGCPLYRDATRTVFGEGLVRSKLMLVGEIPGDVEDREGRPFVGPAGRLLQGALEEAGVERSDAYLTNVVKHFKWEARDGRRLHRTPGKREIDACWPWLQAELAYLRPRAVVALGATAAKTLFGPEHRVTRQRGERIETPWAPHATSTLHPSAVLRRPDGRARREERERLVADLRRVAAWLTADGE